MALNCIRALQKVAKARLATCSAVTSSRGYATGALPEAVEPAVWRNPAAVLHGVNDLRFEDVPMPDRLQDEYVRIEMKAVGICGSDVHYWKKARPCVASLGTLVPWILASILEVPMRPCLWSYREG